MARFLFLVEGLVISCSKASARFGGCTVRKQGRGAARPYPGPVLRKLVLDSAPSPHTQRNYAKALDDLFAFFASRPLSRSLLMEWRARMESLSPSTINVRLSAVCKMVGEARRNAMIGSEEAASLTDIPNIRQKGTRLGNWLAREQAKELLAVPDRSTLKGVILAFWFGPATAVKFGPLGRHWLGFMDGATEA